MHIKFDPGRTPAHDMLSRESGMTGRTAGLEPIINSLFYSVPHIFSDERSVLNEHHRKKNL